MSLSTVNDDLKSIKSTIKKEFVNQNTAISETEKNIAQLSTQSESIVSSLNGIKTEQDLISKKLNENLQALSQFAITTLVFIVFMIFGLWTINQKLKKGIAIRFGQALDNKAADQKSPNYSSSIEASPSESNNLSSTSTEHGISAEEFQKLMSHQITNNTFSLHTSIPANEKILISAAMDSAIEKRLQGFMRPVQPPKL